MTMDQDRWARVQDVFGEALEMESGARAAYLQRACADDAELRAEVDSLLQAATDADAYFDDLADRAGITQELGTSFGPHRPPPDLEGRRIGAYRLGRLLGRGGMGAVYLAERDDGQFEHTVALKLLAMGAAGEQAHRRFLEERRILARLDHPAIARLFDGGVTEDATPYFVMELVEGVPITRYVREMARDVEARLRLFLDVCDAVSYAHRKLVVHRDLKPSNILVSRDGQPKLLDFGVARVLRGDGDTDPPTEGAGRLMTPRYASPEQLRGEPVTTATDVYTLGVILHELLTGTSPYGAPDDSAALMDAIVEQPVTAPSARVARAGPDEEATAEAARAMGATIPALRRRLRGDLDTIVLKALRKEPERRYGSVEALAEDVRRHLAGYPVRARPDGVAYVTSRFLGRNAPAVAAVVALMLLGTAVVVQSVRFAVTSSEQARLITRERDKAEEIAHFMRELFEVANPALTDGETVTARELLDRGADKIRNDHPDEPEIQAEMMTVLGTVYQHLGLPRPAMELLQEARRIQQAHPGLVPPASVAETLYELGLALREAGEPQASVAVLTEARARLRDLYGPRDRAVALAGFGLARSLHLTGDYQRAEAEFQGAVTGFRALDLAPDDEYAHALYLLAEYLQVRGDDPAETERYYLESLAVTESLHGSNHPNVSDVLVGLASVRNGLEDHDSATALLRRALDLDRRLYGQAEGPGHPDLAYGYMQLGRQLARFGDADEAERLLREALGMYEVSPVAQADTHALTLMALADLLRSRGEHAQALSRYVQATDLIRTAYGPGSLMEAGVAVDRSALLVDMNRPADAVPLLKSALTAYDGVLPEDHTRVRQARDLLVRAQASLH